MGLRGRDRGAVLRIVNGVGQQAGQRQRFAGDFARDLQRLVPAAYRAGDGQRRTGPAMGDMRQTVVGGKRCPRTCRAAGVNGDGVAFRRHDKPETIAAQPVHMRVNHGDGGRCRDHRLYRAAAFAQHRQRALAGKMVGRNGHAVRGDITLHEESS